MARRFRLWLKKRGDRQTGDRLVGSLGEAFFFAALFLLGSISLVGFVTYQVLHSGPAGPDLLDWGFWLVLMVLASFVAIGGVGVGFTVLQAGTSVERRSALAKQAGDMEIIRSTSQSSREYPTVPRDANLINSPGVALSYRLPVIQSSAWKLGVVTLFCLVWNGISVAMLVTAVDGHRNGHPEWTLTVFAVPFLAVGGWSVYYFVRELILHISIGPTSVEISDHPLRPGRRYQIHLTQSGRLSIRSLELSLVCAEEATYRQGTDIRTETQQVHEQRLFREEAFEINPGKPFETQCEFEVPAGAMHSFRSASNAVHWKFVVKGDARGWPVYERSFPVLVYPRDVAEPDKTAAEKTESEP